MQAKVALKHDEVPVGAVIVDKEGEIVSRAYNRMEHTHCQTGHAEVRAIERACAKRGDWRLDGCTIYITLEPCLMCFGLICLSRFKTIIYGATSPLFGCGLDKKDAFPVYRKGLVIEHGLLQDESAELLRMFFKKRRKKGGQ